MIFILRHYFPGEPFPKKQISKNYHYDNRTQVMNKLGLVAPDLDFDKSLLREAKALAKRHALPKFVLQELLDSCLHKKVVKPAYSTLQNIVSQALRLEQQRLANKLYTAADKSLRAALDTLLDNEDLFYNLTLLKRDQKSFSTSEVKHCVAKQQMLRDIYVNSQRLMPDLGISEQNIIYYANLAEFYTIQKLKQLKNINLVRLYLLCYAHRRFLKINDHLVASFNFKVNLYIASADEYQRGKVDTVEAVDKKMRSRACEVLAVNINQKIPDEQVREHVFSIIPRSDYKQFLADFKKPNLNREYYRWEHYGNLSAKIKMNLRPLFNALDFTCAIEKMGKSVEFLKQHLAHHHAFKSYRYSDVPTGFFPKSARKFLTYKVRDNRGQILKKIDGDRYEFMVYLQLFKGLADGSVFVKDSNGYRALEDELIDLEYWINHKHALLAELNMPLLSMSITTLLGRLEVIVHQGNLT